MSPRGKPDRVPANDLSWQTRGEAAVKARQALLVVVERQHVIETRLRDSLAALHLRDSALGAISQGVTIADADDHTTYMNRAWEDITGYTAAEMVGRSADMLQGPGTDPERQEALRKAVAGALPFHGELLNYRKDGTPFWNELSVTPVFDPQGRPTQSVRVMRDVTARRDADAELLLASKLFDQSGEGFLVTDAEGRILKVNRAFTTITGYSEAESLGQNPRFLGSGRHDAAFFRSMWHEVAAHGHWRGEIWNRRKCGAVFLQWLSMSRVMDNTGRVTHHVAAFSDITKLKEAEDSLHHLAYFDLLTGLPNRALLDDRATLALKAANGRKEPVALMFIDLDHFKKVNDSLGHDIGDRLLVALAERFKLALREQDTLCRRSGDEFLLLLPGTGAEEAAHLAHRLLQLSEQPHQIGAHELTITSSIGIALFPDDGPDLASLSKCADAAMCKTKHCGRNTFRFYTAEIQAQSARLLVLESALRRALERGQMQLYFQPQKSLHDGAIVGAEALLRWHHPDLGWVSPAEFIPVAESSGLITSIGEWVLRSAVQQLKAWAATGLGSIDVAVNLSTVQFRQQHLPELLAQLLEEAGVPPARLELELTESVAADDPDAAIAMMNRLRAVGVHMSIDDFGTGYSSLSYLKRFKVYKLKIDQTFVRGITEDADDQAIVSAIISMARSLGLRTIAEGVETVEQMAYLRAAGCDEMQGYLLSRPVPAPAFEAFVRAWVPGDGTAANNSVPPAAKP